MCQQQDNKQERWLICVKILAVDDETGALSALAQKINKVLPDAELATFLLPKDALAYAKKNVCDITFLDIDMPQMGGIELAGRLKETNPRMNIIFVTAYSQYGIDAFALHASGHLLKPVCSEDIRQELDHLRFPVSENKKGIRAVTFGQFDLLSDGRTIHFGRAKSKELLAYLIDRHGGGVTKKEIASVLFEDKEYTRATQDYLNKIVRELEKSLKNAGAEDILVKERNYYAANTKKFTCDLYEYEQGKETARQAFSGEYMTQYSWAEETLGKLICP